MTKKKKKKIKTSHASQMSPGGQSHPGSEPLLYSYSGFEVHSLPHELGTQFLLRLNSRVESNIFPPAIYPKSGNPKLSKVFQGSSKGILGEAFFLPEDLEFCHTEQSLSQDAGLSRWNPSRPHSDFPRALQEEVAPPTELGDVDTRRKGTSLQGPEQRA